MKQFILSVAAIVFLATFSQAQFKLGITGGADRTNQRINTSQGNSLYAGDRLHTWHAGLIGELKIAGNFYLQPQLLYTQKGSMLQSSLGESDMQVKINYVEMPVNILYKLPVPFGSVFAGAGASAGYGFSGKQEQNGIKRSIYKDVKTWKHEDFSYSFTAGLEFNSGIFLSVSSRKGLYDVYKADGMSIKNRSQSVSIGYMLNRKKSSKRN